MNLKESDKLVVSNVNWVIVFGCPSNIHSSLISSHCSLLSSCVQLVATPWTTHQASLSLTISQSFPKFMGIASVKDKWYFL